MIKYRIYQCGKQKELSRDDLLYAAMIVQTITQLKYAKSEDDCICVPSEFENASLWVRDICVKTVIGDMTEMDGRYFIYWCKYEDGSIELTFNKYLWISRWEHLQSYIQRRLRGEQRICKGQTAEP